MRAEIAHARLHVELAVRTNCHQPVVADRAGAVRANRDADPGDLRAVAPARSLHAFVPVELLDAAIERFLDERARDVTTGALRIRRTVERLAFGRIHPADRDLIDAKLL